MEKEYILQAIIMISKTSFDAIVSLMDDEIRENIHNNLNEDITDTNFLALYLEKHEEK